MKKSIPLLLSLLAPATLAFAQVSWTGNSDGVLWNTAGNWSTNSVPSSSSNVTIDVTPPVGNAGEAPYLSDRVIAFINNDQNAIGSLTLGSSLNGTIKFVPVGSETLKVNGFISNNSSFSQIFTLQVDAGASATWSGSLQFQNTVDIGLNSITWASGSSVTFSGTSLRFDIQSASTYGRFLGSGYTTNFSGVTINLGGAYSGGTAGDTFDFTTTTFTGATIGTLPTLSSGLTWNTSQFLSQGVLTVQAVPEPASFAVMAGLGTLGFMGARRRKRVAAT